MNPTKVSEFKVCQHARALCLQIAEFYPKITNNIKHTLGDILITEADRLHKLCRRGKRGFRCLGYRIRKDIVIPNKTIIYNMQYKVSQYIKAARNEAYIRNNAEHFMAVVNSYMGFMKWAYTARLRRKILNAIKHSAWGSIFDIRKDLSAITIKAECKPIAKRIKRNKEMRQVIRNTWH